jgi:hypothetical protein
MFSTGGRYVTGSAMQRTALVGCMGARHEEKMENLNVEDYEAMHLLEARFLRIEGSPNGRVEFHGHQDTGVLFYMFTELGLEDFCGELGFFFQLRSSIIALRTGLSTLRSFQR